MHLYITKEFDIKVGYKMFNLQGYYQQANLHY